MICTYSGMPAKDGFWSGIHPLTPQCATNDVAEVSRVQKAVSQGEWLELPEGIKQIPRPFREGLYQLDLSHRDQYADADHVDRLCAYLHPPASASFEISEPAWRKAVSFLLLIHLHERVSDEQIGGIVALVLLAMAAGVPLVSLAFSSWLWGTLAVLAGLVVFAFFLSGLSDIGQRRWIRDVLIPMANDRGVDLTAFGMLLKSIDSEDETLPEKVRRWGNILEDYSEVLREGVYQVDLSHLEQYEGIGHVYELSSHLRSHISPALLIDEDKWMAAVEFLLQIHRNPPAPTGKLVNFLLFGAIASVISLPFIIPALWSWLWGPLAIVIGLLVLFVGGGGLLMIHKRRWILRVLMPMAQSRGVDLEMLGVVIGAIDLDDEQLSSNLRKWGEIAEDYKPVMDDLRFSQARAQGVM